MMQIRTYLILLAVAVMTACPAKVIEKSSENYQSAIRAFYVGLAALQVGDDVRAASELKHAVELAPSEPAAFANLGILQLRQKDLENAAKSLETARSLNNENPHIHSTIALLETQRGDFDAAQKAWQRSIDLDPTNTRAIFALAKEKERQTQDAEALKLVGRIVQARPDNLAAQLELLRLSAKLDQKEMSAAVVAALVPRSAAWEPEIRAQFESLRSAAGTGDRSQIVQQTAYFRNVMLRLPEFRRATAEISYSDTTLGEPFTRPLTLPVPDHRPAPSDVGISFGSQKMAENVVWSRAVHLNGDEQPVPASGSLSNVVVGAAKIPFSTDSAQGLIEIDFDFDFQNDLAMAGPKGFRLFKQDKGSFSDVTAATKLGSDVTQKAYSGAWVLDVESDGDLDILLGSAAGHPVVLQNNADGSFVALDLFNEVSDIISAAAADLDEDGDSDVVLLDAAGNLNVFSNERGGLFRKRNLDGLTGKCAGLTIADINGDGILDIVDMTTDGTIIRITDRLDGTAWDIAALTSAGPLGDNPTLLSHDIDNNGAADLIIGSGSSTKVFLGGDETLTAAAPVAGRISSIADMNSDGKLDLVGTAENAASVFINQSQAGYGWQVIRPRAAKTSGDQRVNSFGIGGEIEVRAGLLMQKRQIAVPFVHFGLGKQQRTDVMRVVWQNGYTQAEFDLGPDQVIAAEQRLKGSCPHLFTFDGEGFQMVKDAPPWSPALGLKINAQDTYGVLATEEWFKIPGTSLKPTKDNFYELRITGEYWETYYVDHYSLLVVDHPVNTEIFTDERFAIPLPPLKVFTTEPRREFALARNDTGSDVAAIVRDLDERYLDGVERGKFQGVAADHYVELELPADAPSDRKLWLLADGWVHPTDASINVQLGQSSLEKPRGLSLEVPDEAGNWKTVKKDLGFPAGKMKTVMIDLPPGARRFRLRTNMEVFWDRLAWAADQAGTANKIDRLQLDTAALRYRGFSVIDKADDSSPEKPSYDQLLATTERWRSMTGYFTRYGDVRELLTGVDDRYVMTNAGDEFILRFAAPAPVAPGFIRDFVLIGDGWIKDGDLNSVFSKTVLPLPTHVNNDYSRPPTTLEDDPVYKQHKVDWTTYHTRYVAPDSFRNALR